EMMHVLIGAINAFTDKCVVGITANPEKAAGWLAKNPILVTALNPEIGYLNGAAVAKEALATGKTIKEVVDEKGLLPPERVAALPDVRAMTEGGLMGAGGAGGSCVRGRIAAHQCAPGARASVYVGMTTGRPARYSLPCGSRAAGPGAGGAGGPASALLPGSRAERLREQAREQGGAPA